MLDGQQSATLWSLLLFVLSPTLFGSAAGSPTPDTVVVSNEMCNGLFLVPLAWSGEDGESHEFVAVFDTGGSNFFIDPDALERTVLTRLKPGTRVRMQDVKVAGLRFTKFQPRIRELDHLSHALGRGIDVFLPFHTFDEFLLTLDYSRNELRVSKGSLPPPDGLEVFSSHGRDRRPWLSVHIGSKPRNLLLDSGSNGTISVYPDPDLPWDVEPIPLRLAQGMKEVELSMVGRLEDSVSLGPLTLENPIVSLTEDTELIGSQVLSHFILTFDQKHRRVRLRSATGKTVKMAPRRGTGVLMRSSTGAFEIAHIVSGSPAQEAGLIPGDRITHIDGIPVPELGCRRKSPGKEFVRYSVRRDGRAFEIQMPLAVLIP